MPLLTFIIIVVAILASSLKIVNEYERGVRFTLGKFTGLMQHGLRIVIPVIQAWERVDLRVNVIDVPKQDAMTKDNVSVEIDAVVYFRVSDPEKAILNVMNYHYAISQLAQTTMRDAAGEISLYDLLGKREEVSKRILKIIDVASDPWGIKVAMVEVKHVDLPQEMRRAMARQAEAERERRAKIIHAEGEFQAARKISDAAKIMAENPISLQLRFLQTITEVASENNSTIVLPLPIDIIKPFLDLAERIKN